MSKAKLLILLFGFYTFLSWILFFRDERAIAVISHQFYPALGPWLESTRALLLTWRLNTIPTFLFTLFICLSFYVYFRALKEKISIKTGIVVASIFQVIVFFSYPILSTDIFGYILSDRLAVVYHQNVWTTRPDKYSADPYFGLADWTDKTKIYGGVNQAIYSPVTQLSGDDLLANLVAHKLVVLFFVVTTLLVVAKFAPAGLVLVFWNPLFILETVGSGHNDILMLFFVSLSAVAFLRRRALLAGLFLALATQVKSTPLLLAIFLGGSYLSTKNFKALFKFGSIYLLTVGAIYYFMGTNPVELGSRVVFSVTLFWQSLPMQINRLFPALLPFLSIGLLILLFIQSLRTLFLRTNPLEIYGQTLLFYFLFFLAAYWNWYALWILALVPFVPGSKLRPYALAFTFSSALGYVAYWVSLRLNYHLPIWSVIIYLTVLSGPAVVFFHDKFSKKISN